MAPRRCRRGHRSVRGRHTSASRPTEPQVTASRRRWYRRKRRPPCSQLSGVNLDEEAANLLRYPAGLYGHLANDSSRGQLLPVRARRDPRVSETYVFPSVFSLGRQRDDGAAVFAREAAESRWRLRLASPRRPTTRSPLCTSRAAAALAVRVGAVPPKNSTLAKNRLSLEEAGVRRWLSITPWAACSELVMSAGNTAGR